jgi:hypothetical protein
VIPPGVSPAPSHLPLTIDCIGDPCNSGRTPPGSEKPTRKASDTSQGLESNTENLCPSEAPERHGGHESTHQHGVGGNIQDPTTPLVILAQYHFFDRHVHEEPPAAIETQSAGRRKLRRQFHKLSFHTTGISQRPGGREDQEGFSRPGIWMRGLDLGWSSRPKHIRYQWDERPCGGFTFHRGFLD